MQLPPFYLFIDAAFEEEEEEEEDTVRQRGILFPALRNLPPAELLESTVQPQMGPMWVLAYAPIKEIG